MSLPLHLVNATGNWYAFVLLEAPLDFARDDRDSGALTRALRLRATARQGAADVCDEDKIDLWRPPVLALHGLWGTAGSWKWRTNAARGVVNFFDYQSTNAAPMAENVARMHGAVGDTLSVFRGIQNPVSEQRAGTQVDLVAHSMGSIVGRRYIANEHADYFRADNYMRGDVHKFVTLGGPHWGSPWAAVIQDVLDVPGVGDLFAWATQTAGLCTNCGGVADLRPEVLRRVGPAPVATHTVYGTGATDLIETATRFPNSQYDDWPVTDAIDWLSWLYGMSFIDLSKLVFGSEPHDMLVGQASASGGLSGLTTTRAPFLPGVHSYMPRSWKLERLAWDAFNAPLQVAAANATFSASLPPGPDYGASASSNRTASESSNPLPPLPSVTPGAIRIVLPDPLPNLLPGSVLKVSIEPTGSAQIQSAQVSIGHDSYAIDAPPFSIDVIVPQEANGPLTIGAVAKLSSGEISSATNDPLPVDEPESPISLVLLPSVLPLEEGQAGQALRVFGIYRDGTRRELSGADHNSTYASDATGIAAVSDAGVVAPVSPGKTRIEVRNAGLSAFAEVVVRTAPKPEPLAKLAIEITGAPGPATIQIVPPDINSVSDASASGARWYPAGAQVSVVAPAVAGRACLTTFSDNGTAVSGRSLNLVMDTDHSIKADFVSSSTLSVAAAGTGAPLVISVLPVDIDNLSTGAAPFQRAFCSGTSVTLQAPERSGDARFIGWNINGETSSANPLTLVVANPVAVRAQYARVSPPTGTLGTEIHIYGSHLGAKLSPVQVGANGKCRTTSRTDDEIICTLAGQIPRGSATIVLRKGDGSRDRITRGLTIVGPMIAGVDAGTILPGATVTIRGSYFGTKSAGSIVKIAGKNCVVKSWQADTIVVAMPAKLPAGNATLVVKNVVGSASLPIVVGP